MNAKKSIIAAAIVISIATIVYYRFYFKTAEPNISGSQAETSKELAGVSKEVSAIAVYAVPGGEDKVRFTLSLDENGTIVGVKSADVIKPNEFNANLEKFNDGLTVVIKGRKLSELGNIDRVGTSSLTTSAFNNALSELKSQI